MTMTEAYSLYTGVFWLVLFWQMKRLKQPWPAPVLALAFGLWGLGAYYWS